MFPLVNQFSVNVFTVSTYKLQTNNVQKIYVYIKKKTIQKQ